MSTDEPEVDETGALEPEGFSLELEQGGGGIVQRAAVLQTDADLDDTDEDGSADDGDDDHIDPDDDDSPLDPEL